MTFFDDLLLLHRRAKIPRLYFISMLHLIESNELSMWSVRMTASLLTWLQCWMLAKISPEDFNLCCVDRHEKKFQLWTLGASYHNSCSMMVLNESRITTASWDFLCLCFERRLSKEFGLAKHDCASSFPLLSFRTTVFALSDYFSFCTFSPAQNSREVPYSSD